MNTVLEDTARFYMWATMIPGYIDMTPNQKKKARDGYMSGTLPSEFSPSAEDYQKAGDYPLSTNSFNIPCMAAGGIRYVDCNVAKLIDPPVCISTCCTGVSPQMRGIKPNKAKEEKETTMAYENTNLETSQRNHLTNRLREAEYTQMDAISKKYTPAVLAPTTKDEISRKLLAGEFELPAKYFTSEGELTGFRDALSVIKWTDPTKVQDKTGRDAAMAKMYLAFTAAKDQVIVKSLDDGLKALQDFEATTF